MTRTDEDRLTKLGSDQGGLPTADEVCGTCDWGGCDGEVVGVRWNDTGDGIVAWLGVCGAHLVDAMHVGAFVVPAYALPGGDRG